MTRIARKSAFLLAWLLSTSLVVGQAAGASTLDFPRLSSDPETLTGVAIVNPTTENAQVTITAYDAAGDELAQSQLQVPPGSQAGVLTADLFPGLGPGVVGWFRAESETSGLTGFFLFLDTAGTMLDGADLPSPSRRIVFTQVRVGGAASTELNLVNPGTNPSMVRLALMGGGDVVERSVSLNPRGVARLDVAEAFGAAQAAAGAYVVAEGESDLIGFELLREEGEDTVGLNARVASQLLNSVYFPQIALLGGIRSELTLINGSNASVVVSIAAHQPDGSLFSTPGGTSRVSRNLGPGESLIEDLAGLFGFEGEESLQGWLEVTAPTQALRGSLSYRLGASGAAASVFPQSQGSTRAVFSHIATTLGFFTGVAGLNPGALPADVRLVAVSRAGRRLGSHDIVLKPGERFSRLVTDLIPASAGQAGGFVFVRCSVPVFLTSLFGTVQGSVLANIPPQSAPAGFAPDSGVPTLSVSPRLAVTGPSGSTTFTVGGDAGGGELSVDGDPDEVGEVGVDGVFQAPPVPPSFLPITILAQSGTFLSAGAVDVLSVDPYVSAAAEGTSSLAYLPEAGRAYAAQVLTQFSPSVAPAGPQQSTVVYEVSPPDNQDEIAFLDGETVTDMIPYRSSAGVESLLLAGRTSGSVFRLEPSSGELVTVATGLNAPRQLAWDSRTDNLLVAEEDRVSSLSRFAIDAASPNGLSQAGLVLGGETRQGVLFEHAGVGGVAVDACGGNILFSDRVGGRVMEWDRSSGQVHEIAGGLGLPGQVTALYRRGVGCPDAFQLAVTQADTGDFALLAPSLGAFVNPWFPGEGSDLAVAPGLFGAESVLVSESSGDILSLSASNLYQPSPVNPPANASGDATVAPGPDLEIGSVTLDGRGQVTLQVRFRPGVDDGEPGGSDQMGSLVFSIDYDESRLDFDPADNDQDGVPDAITSQLPPGYSVFARFLPDRSNGEINLVVADAFAPLQPIPEGDLVSLTFSVRESAAGSADALFSTAPPPSAADLLAQIRPLDETVGGTVTIVP